MKFKESFEYDIHHNNYCDELFEKYELGEELYRSKNSYIYHLTDKKSRKEYLLKAVRLQRHVVFDMDIVTKLDHKNLAKIYEYGFSDKFLYMRKEYVIGEDLASYVDKNGAFSESEALQLIEKVGEILSYLHKYQGRTIVFRDLKPSNIIYTKDKQIKLIDLITVREVKEERDTDTFYIGSKGYSAPEQYGFMQSTEKADVYSLGSTLFYLISGDNPKNNRSIYEQLEEYKDISKSLKEIIRKATEFSPKERYASVNKLLKALSSQNERRRRGHIIILGLFFGIVIIMTSIWIYPQLITKQGEPSRISNNNPVLEISTSNYGQIDEINVSTKEDPEEPIEDPEEPIEDPEEPIEEIEEPIEDPEEPIEEIEDPVEDPEESVEETEEVEEPVKEEVSMSLQEMIATYKENLDLESLISIESGIEFRFIEEDIIQTKIDSNYQHEELQTMKYMSVGSSYVPYETEDLRESIYSAAVEGAGLMEYSEDGYHSKLINANHLMVIVYNEEKNPLGYYIYNNIDFTEAIVDLELEAVSLDSFYTERQMSDIIRIEEDTSAVTFYVNEEMIKAKLPLFSHLSVWASAGGITNQMMKDMFEHSDQGSQLYESEGYRSSLNGVESYTQLNWVILFLDDQKNVLAHYTINKTD